jgi:hypothetical protein
LTTEDSKKIFSPDIVKDSVWKDDVLVAEKKVSFFSRKDYKESFTRETKVFIAKSCAVGASIMPQRLLIQQSARDTVSERIIAQKAAFTL